MTILILALLAVLFLAVWMLMRYEKALIHISHYRGDCMDAREHAEMASRALHWSRQ
jgi:hypothetical protein